MTVNHRVPGSNPGVGAVATNMTGITTMGRVNNLDSQAKTLLVAFNQTLSDLQPGQKAFCPNTKDEILRIRENLMKRRADIPGADSHLEYVEALLIAEANGQLEFKK